MYNYDGTPERSKNRSPCELTDCRKEPNCQARRTDIQERVGQGLRRNPSHEGMIRSESEATLAKIRPHLRAYGSIHPSDYYIRHSLPSKDVQWLSIDGGDSNRNDTFSWRRAVGILGTIVCVGIALTATHAKLTADQQSRPNDNLRHMGKVGLQVRAMHALLAWSRVCIFDVDKM